jgi:hypothetical protein
MRCDECGEHLACEVEHVCHCPDHGGERVVLCGACGSAHKDKHPDCVGAVKD